MLAERNILHRHVLVTQALIQQQHKQYTSDYTKMYEKTLQDCYNTI